MSGSVAFLRYCHLTVLMKIHFEGLNILLEAQRTHGPKKVVTVDSLAFLFRALVAGPESMYDTEGVKRFM